MVGTPHIAACSMPLPWTVSELWLIKAFPESSFGNNLSRVSKFRQLGLTTDNMVGSVNIAFLPIIFIVALTTLIEFRVAWRSPITCAELFVKGIHLHDRFRGQNR